MLETIPMVDEMTTYCHICKQLLEATEFSRLQRWYKQSRDSGGEAHFWLYGKGAAPLVLEVWVVYH